MHFHLNTETKTKLKIAAKINNGIDLREHDKENLLIIAENTPLVNQNKCTSNFKLKSAITRYGIPEEVVSDSSAVMFSETLPVRMDFRHTSSSSHNPLNNGHAERAVQIGRRIPETEGSVAGPYDLQILSTQQHLCQSSCTTNK